MQLQRCWRAMHYAFVMMSDVYFKHTLKDFVYLSMLINFRSCVHKETRITFVIDISNNCQFIIVHRGEMLVTIKLVLYLFLPV